MKCMDCDFPSRDIQASGRFRRSSSSKSKDFGPETLMSRAETTHGIAQVVTALK